MPKKQKRSSRKDIPIWALVIGGLTVVGIVAFIRLNSINFSATLGQGSQATTSGVQSVSYTGRDGQPKRLVFAT